MLFHVENFFFQSQLTTDHKEFIVTQSEAKTTLTIKLQRPNPNEEEVGGLILEAMELTARRFCDEDI